MEYKDVIKSLRLEHGLTQIQIAEMLKVSKQSYSTYENGREMGYENLKILSDYYHVSIDYLIGKEDYRSDVYADLGNKLKLSDQAIASIRTCMENDLLLNEFISSDKFPELMSHITDSTLYNPKMAMKILLGIDVDETYPGTIDSSDSVEARQLLEKILHDMRLSYHNQARIMEYTNRFCERIRKEYLFKKDEQ